MERAGAQVFRAGPSELRLAYTLFLSRLERLDWTIFGQAFGQRLARRWVRGGSLKSGNFGRLGATVTEVESPRGRESSQGAEKA